MSFGGLRTGPLGTWWSCNLPIFSCLVLFREHLASRTPGKALEAEFSATPRLPARRPEQQEGLFCYQTGIHGLLRPTFCGTCVHSHAFLFV
jgi:hypothetical protein